ncbi:DNA/RNA non-specific endonuclease [Shewanella woodyi]|uniref:DNA/RNA non-specific endonuclease n=1 Tax=Shewanella woodyi TaxID=60961 RepID=UPI003749B1CC
MEWVVPLGLAGCPTIVRGDNDEIISAKATVSPADLGTGTGTNGSSRDYARSLGHSNDDAGHILAKSLGGQGGKGNVFPQLPAVNRGDFRVFEKDVGKLIKNNGTEILNGLLNTLMVRQDRQAFNMMFIKMGRKFLVSFSVINKVELCTKEF